MPEIQGKTSSVYVEVTIPTDNGESVTFYTEEFTTEELDVRAFHEMLTRSEEEVKEQLHLRNKLM